jgi:hypothetical protein
LGLHHAARALEHVTWIKSDVVASNGWGERPAHSSRNETENLQQLTEEIGMYRVYFGTPGCGIPRALEKERWPSREFSQLAEALVWADSVAKRGTVVLAIEGDDGAQLSRTDIATRLGNSLA